MARVFTFWRFPDEEGRFLDYLVKTGDIWACTEKRMSDPDDPRLEPRPVRELLEAQDPEDMLIGPREFMEMALPIDRFELPGRVSYGRYYARVPLISYSRGVFREEGELGRTNLVFESHRTTDRAPQPAGFIQWGQRILTWARRDAPCEIEYKRMTRRVFEAVAGGLLLVP